MTYRIYHDTLKPGERSNGGPWCFTVSRNGHVVTTKTGFYTEEEAEQEAKAYA